MLTYFKNSSFNTRKEDRLYVCLIFKFYSLSKDCHIFFLFFFTFLIFIVFVKDVNQLADLIPEIEDRLYFCPIFFVVTLHKDIQDFFYIQYHIITSYWIYQWYLQYHLTYILFLFNFISISIITALRFIAYKKTFDWIYEKYVTIFWTLKAYFSFTTMEKMIF